MSRGHICMCMCVCVCVCVCVWGGGGVVELFRGIRDVKKLFNILFISL